ncbi:MAG: hypothetical protein A2931_00190 [Candidatus Niyogibacteria bacterium RIFCSPLOWO2_01_FULL_45_48]|uniref:Uncharacterized protein n=1 Tax=Candidatus Niyogibacteria bacterium RIFCSPLOWO2_01_FULL_45_48 TaxID=1801724 RepID=A0A1G2EY99_9BACT|nr:MAG: hypothetical protein A2931_00190 [Candidatus Niyogibacteria bacterium RIFCSPLOWO2_01_FULL_45_48]
MARQRNFLKETFDLFGQRLFSQKVLFLARPFLFCAVVIVMTLLDFCGNSATTGSTFEQAKKSKVMFANIFLFATLRHDFLARIKKFL